jgi:aminoglycoside phosphotransferase
MISIPNEILKIVKDLSYKIDDVGQSEDIVIVYEETYVLKISNDIERLSREKEKIDWLDGKIPSPRSILFVVEDEKAYYLRTFLKGESLINDKFIKEPDRLISMLVKAFKLLRNLDDYDCPFNSLESVGNDFVHGDLCLPNILVLDDEISGFIDLDNSGLGDMYHDISWMLWSLEYNLKTDKYNDILLSGLGITFDLEKFEKYIPLEYRKIHNN